MPTANSILVVDDDASMLVGIERLLRNHGFDVSSFRSGTALLRVADFGNAFCVILDINLDGQSGIDVHHALAARGVKLPVIFITGNDSDANRSAALESGCVAYLIKPFSAVSLLEPIEAAHAAILH